MDRDPVADVVIIGEGPAGEWMLFRLKSSAITPRGEVLLSSLVLIDNQRESGGQLVLYRDKPVFDVPTQPIISGQDIASKLQLQADDSPYFKILGYVPHCTVIRGATTTSLTRDQKGIFLVSYETNEGPVYYHEIKSRSVVIAGGMGPISLKRFGNPDFDKWEGGGLYFIVESASIFAGRNVLLVGGGDTALDWAQAARKSAKLVTLIHRRKEPSRDCKQPSLFYQFVRNGIALVPYELKEIHGDDSIHSVKIVNKENGEEKELSVDIVVACLGSPINREIFESWGLQMSERGIWVNPRTMETSIPGVFAIGDIADAFDLASNYIDIACATATIAKENVLRYLTGKKPHLPHSSSVAARKRK